MATDGCSLEFRNFFAYRSVQTKLYKHPATLLSGKRKMEVKVWKSIITIII